MNTGLCSGYPGFGQNMTVNVYSQATCLAYADGQIVVNCNETILNVFSMEGWNWHHSVWAPFGRLWLPKGGGFYRPDLASGRKC